MRTWVRVLASSVWLMSLSALAQDDLLSPLSPEPQAKPKPKPKAKAKPVHTRKPTKAEDDMVAPLITKKTELWVKVSPPSKDAVWSLDGNPMGALPEHAVEVSTGEHIVAVKRPGYSDFSQRVTAAEGQVTELAAVLEPSSGLLSVTSDVSGSAITVDGHPLGNAPVREIGLAPGTHDVVVRHDGFEDDTSRIMVRAGKQYTVSAHLRAVEQTHTIVAREDRPTAVRLVPNETPETQATVVTDEGDPLYKRWYVWTGAAVVVAAVVTTVLVVKSNGSTTQGLKPSDVCGGTCNGTINAPAFLPRF